MKEDIITFPIGPWSLLDLFERNKDDFDLSVDSFLNGIDRLGCGFDFLKQKPKPGIYQINFGRNLLNVSRESQEDLIPEKWSFPHPAVLVQAMINYFDETSSRLLFDWSSYTSVVLEGALDGNVIVRFGENGVIISSVEVENEYEEIGVATTRAISFDSVLGKSLSDFNNLTQLKESLFLKNKDEKQLEIFNF